VNADTTGTAVTTDHPSGAIFGEPVTFSAAVANTTSGLASVIPQGTVTFVDTTTGTTLGSKPVDPTGHAALTVNNLSARAHTIQATYAEPANNYAGNSASTTQTVNQGTTSTSLASSKSPAAFGESVTFTATISPVAPSALTPSGTVSFADTTTGTAL